MCKCVYIQPHAFMGMDTVTRYSPVGPFPTPPTVVLHFHMTVVGWTLEALDNE